MGKNKINNQVLSLANYLKEYNDYFPSVSTQKALGIINQSINSTSSTKINQTELLAELRKINPYVLTLLCNSFEECGYNNF